VDKMVEGCSCVYTEEDGKRVATAREDVIECLKKYAFTVFEAKKVLKAAISEIDNRIRWM